MYIDKNSPAMVHTAKRTGTISHMWFSLIQHSKVWRHVFCQENLCSCHVFEQVEDSEASAKKLGKKK